MLGPNSVKSQVISNVTVPLKSPCHRAASVQCITFVPEIVVTSTRVEDEMAAEDSSPQSSRQLSRLDSFFLYILQYLTT
jgi:hypothetical protein